MSEAELRLLGPVDVVLEGQALDVGHARQLVVLAALAVEVNQPTPPDRLVDRVWGNHPPQRAREALQSYLSRLRKALRPTGMVIAHRPNGYLLEAEPTAVDLHRFRAWVEQAGSLDDAEAYPLLDQAQSLWRGPVLESADTPWADQVRHALDGERFAAELRRTDVGLRLGLHADLVAGLVAAGAEHPWDERLAAQTMLALYRCGRVADALESYRGVPGPAGRRAGLPSRGSCCATCTSACSRPIRCSTCRPPASRRRPVTRPGWCRASCSRRPRPSRAALPSSPSSPA